jgi:hypothetical protein
MAGFFMSGIWLEHRWPPNALLWAKTNRGLASSAYLAKSSNTDHG